MRDGSGSRDAVLREEREEDLLWLTLDEPERANALSPPLLARLTEVYGRDLLGEGIRAVLLRGAGEHFSAGADLEHLGAQATAGRDEHRRDSERLRALFAAILKQEALTIALVHGACIAGGCGLATAHDFVVAAEDSRFMYSEARIGFVPALVATFLPLRMRGRDIRELLLDPEFVSAGKALEIGLVNRVVERKSLEASGKELATGILERTSSTSVALTKRLLLEVLGLPLDDALAVAARINAESRETADCRRGVATFLETKSTPRWR